jgi:hypothetical protein
MGKEMTEPGRIPQSRRWCRWRWWLSDIWYRIRYGKWRQPVYYIHVPGPYLICKNRRVCGSFTYVEQK